MRTTMIICCLTLAGCIPTGKPADTPKVSALTEDEQIAWKKFKRDNKESSMILCAYSIKDKAWKNYCDALGNAEWSATRQGFVFPIYPTTRAKSLEFIEFSVSDMEELAMRLARQTKFKAVALIEPFRGDAPRVLCWAMDKGDAPEIHKGPLPGELQASMEAHLIAVQKLADK